MTLEYARKTLSPVEVTKAICQRIAELNPSLNAYCHFDPDSALASAQTAEHRWMHGRSRGPLDGVPVSIKDFFAVRGWPTRRGSKVLATSLPDADDAPAVARLREAGAVLLGKTSTTEFGHKASGISSLNGVTRNPWNLAWTSGGSSCGAAAAAAAGLGPLHLGSDAAGSIRVPASFCGVYGHKPTSRLVPAHPASASGDLAVLGPIARSVDDAEMMLQVIAQPDRRDGRASARGALRSESTSSSVRGLKFALAAGVNDCIANADVWRQVQAVASSLQAHGAVVEEIELKIDDLLANFLTVWNTFVATSARNLSASELDLIEPTMLRMIEQGRRISAIEFNAAQLFLTEVGSRIHGLFEGFDALLLPTLPFPAFAADAEHPGAAPEVGWLAWAETVFLFNATAMPASSLPCGFSAARKPIGIQVVGPAFSDSKVMHLCKLIRELVPVPTLAAPLHQGH
jgi:aspartyl-tRNA(Asn)/glutamyl-tRNA(Gln) amidotransferase subunit A